MNAKVRIRRRHLPTGTVVQERERTATEQVEQPAPPQSTNQRGYAPTTVYRFTNGGYEAVTRR